MSAIERAHKETRRPQGEDRQVHVTFVSWRKTLLLFGNVFPDVPG